VLKWVVGSFIVFLGLAGGVVILQGVTEQVGVVQVGHVQIQSAAITDPSSPEEALVGDGGRLARYQRIFSLQGLKIPSMDGAERGAEITVPVSAPTDGLLELVIAARDEQDAELIFRLSVTDIDERLRQWESNLPDAVQLSVGPAQLEPAMKDYSSRNSRLFAGTILLAVALGSTLVAWAKAKGHSGRKSGTN
jgi:hypothetical protein